VPVYFFFNRLPPGESNHNESQPEFSVKSTGSL